MLNTRNWSILATLALSLLLTACSKRPSCPTSEEPETEQERAVKSIEKIGGKITRDQTKADSPVICVDLTGRQVTDAEMKVLGKLTQLQELCLAGDRITDAGLKELARLSQLQGLNLEATDVTDAGMKDLAVLKQLQWLSLSGTRVTDAGLKDLTGLKQLKILVIYYNIGVTETGKKSLKASLPQCDIKH